MKKKLLKTVFALAVATLLTNTAFAQCTATGKLLWEQWQNVSWSSPADWTTAVAKKPDANAYLTSFDFPQGLGNTYVARARGFICAPVTGKYIFYLSSDDQSELFLSTDNTPGNKKLINSVPGYTNYQSYTKYPTQIDSVNLVAGTSYYIEALLEQGGGKDHLTVAWTRPDSTGKITVLPAYALSPVVENIYPTIKLNAPNNGDAFDKTQNVTVKTSAIDVDGTVDSVVFFLDGKRAGVIQASPFNFTFTALPLGSHSIYAVAYDNDLATGNTVTISISISDKSLVAVPCAGITDSLKREFFANFTGTLSQLDTLSTTPVISHLGSFDAPQNVADHYGQRVTGYICAPFSGVYTFWVASDDDSQLWLSTDETKANLKSIAYVNGSSGYQNWTNNPSQQSDTIRLVAGQKYYIRALMREITGNDYLSVGWYLPNGIYERPIPAQRFYAPTVTALENQTILTALPVTVYPVPAQNEANVLWFAPIASETSLEVKDLAGKTILNKTISATTGENKEVISTSGFESGYYILVLKTGNSVATKKFIITK